jgi:eukaryotic-like serine/threonine-protein kinase
MREPLELLADEYLTERRRGARVSVEAYADAHPELGDEIRELFPLIDTLESASTHDDQATPLATFQRPERLGDIDLVRELGRGGMGIVYEGVQAKLGRKVAVKVLPQQTLFDQRRLERFEREARTAGSLSHPHIVPIYSVGHADGLHYLVMPLVEGVGLDQLLAAVADGARALRATELRTASGARIALPAHSSAEYWKFAAQLALGAAEALAHAHQQGTLHRDIKPANLLVDQHGQSWVTDFGLAKAMQGDDLSRSGELVGTLRYMAPEQFQGECTPQSDLYALGLTLFEVLTLRPAFPQKQPSEAIRAITQQSVPAPRSINPAVPRDWETLVLKLAAREPQDRYASADELALDLNRLSVGEPIQARPLRPLERGTRWAKRNPLVAGLGLALVLVSAAALMVTAALLRPPPMEQLGPPPPGGESDFAEPRLRPPFGPPGRGPGPWRGPPNQRPRNGPQQGRPPGELPPRPPQPV